MKPRSANLHESPFSSCSPGYQITDSHHGRHGSQMHMPLMTADSSARRIHDYGPPPQFHLPLDIEHGNSTRMLRNGNTVGKFTAPIVSDPMGTTSVHDPSASFVEPKRPTKNDEHDIPGFYQFSIPKPWTEKSTGSHSIARPQDWSPDHDRTAQHLREEFHIGPHVPLNLSIPPDPQADEKPQDLRKLLELAIFGSPQHKLTVAEIYEALSTRFPCYLSLSEDETNAWKSTIRTTLSKSAIFQKVENPGNPCSFWTLDVSNIAASGSKKKRKAARKNSISGCSSQDGTAPSHQHKSSPKMQRTSTREKHTAQHPSTVDARLPPGNHFVNVQVDHEPHVPKRCRYHGAGDMGANGVSLLVNSIPIQTVQDVELITHGKDMDIDKDPISQTHMQNAYRWKETVTSSLPVSLASSLFKSSHADGVHLRPIIDMTEALRAPVQLPPLKDVI